MANFNRIIMMGNLTRDPELKKLDASGQTVCNFTIASNRRYKNKMGALVQDVCFIDVAVWGALAEVCTQHLRKGRQVLVEGRLKQDSWKEADGQPRNKHCIVAENIVFVGSAQPGDTTQESFASEEQSAPASEMAFGSRRAASTPKVDAPSAGSGLFKDEPPFKDFEDELPF